MSTHSFEDEMPHLHRVDTLARILDVSRSLAYQLVAQGVIRSVRVSGAIRVSQDAIDEYIASISAAPQGAEAVK